jgi:hypothetical protein
MFVLGVENCNPGHYCILALSKHHVKMHENIFLDYLFSIRDYLVECCIAV